MASFINYRTSISLVLLITVALRAHFVLGCHDMDREALLKFKQNLTFDPLNRLASWRGEYCCNWSGVRCDNLTGHVNHLNISQYNEIHEYKVVFIQQRLLAQRLDPSLIQLTRLNYLDLSGVDFQGTKIPGFIDSFHRLRYLNLSGSNFDALLPPQLGNLTKLRGLSLSGEDGSFLNWLPNLVNLEYLDMSGSQITRPRDFMGAISKLHSLRDLRLSSCQLGNTLFSANSTWLSKIRHLELSFNNIESLSPRVFSSMTSLTYLDLSINFLSGSVPRWLRNMRALEHLDLSSNSLREHGESIMKIAGNFKVFVFSSNSLQEQVVGPCWNLSNRGTSQLEELYLFDCNIIGTLPHCLSDFRKLKILDLSFNQISGQIPPSIGNLSFLQSLSLRDNSLRGRIPSSIGGLSSLKTLYLSNNYLDGSIPNSLGQLNNLVYFDLSSNLLEGVVSESHLRNLSSLDVLDLSNNSISVTLNSEWRPPFQLSSLYMSSCKINGEFPNWIKSQRELNTIDLSNTGISGELPRWFWNMTLDIMILSHNHIEGTIGDLSYTLLILDLSYNSISGSLRRSLCQLSELNHLDLQSNELSGSIPDCWVRSNSQLLGTINLSSNKLTGLIPKTIGELVNLSFLSLNNSLEGEIPDSFSTGRKLLQIIDLGENQVSGSVPGFSVKSHPYLKILRLRENKLTGKIPERLCSLPSVQVLDLANNNLTGDIPRCFANFSSMKFLPSPNTPSTNLVFPDGQSTTETVKSQELTYTKNLKYLVNLDLSCNGLQGSIPERIVDLSGLIGLNLSHNHLSGNIPKNIGEMKPLESLDLAYNHLSGTIPSGLASLTYLSSLNISNNQLVGQIPTGSQLQVLDDPSIYAGNPGLCGDPLPNKCGSTDEKQPPQQEYESELDKKDNRETILFFFVVFSGFATGFWGVFGSVLLNRSFKFALFQLMNNTTDYFYMKIMVIIDRLTK